MNSIISIVNLKERYLQLNIRSLVEHISRISLDKSYSGGDFDGCVRRKDFEFLKKKNHLKTGDIFIMFILEHVIMFIYHQNQK